MVYSREEIEAIWERLNKLEQRQREDALKLAGSFAAVAMGLLRSIAQLRLAGSSQEASVDKYIKTKYKRALEEIAAADSVDKVFKRLDRYFEDVIDYMSSL